VVRPEAATQAGLDAVVVQKGKTRHGRPAAGGAPARAASN